MNIQQLCLRAGDDWPIIYYFINDDGSAIDLTGCTVIFGMKSVPLPNYGLQLNSTVTGSGITLDPTNGAVTIDPSGAVTDNLPIGLYESGVKIIFSDGSKRTVGVVNIAVQQELAIG